MRVDHVSVLLEQAVLRVSGDKVTPFTPANQQLLINVFADASRNISQSQIRIVMVNDAYTSRRRLQANTSFQSLQMPLPCLSILLGGVHH